MTQSVDLFVDRGFFFDIGTTLDDKGLRLVVVIVAHEVVDSTVWKEFLELLSQLSGERLVVSHDEGGSLELLYDIRHGERLPRTRHTEECLEIIARAYRLDELGYRSRLITGWLVWRVEREEG